jgi:hypothetical protein
MWIPPDLEAVWASTRALPVRILEVGLARACHQVPVAELHALLAEAFGSA